ncbi:hypothetical protein KY290_036710 [Solanum tuberosum]|uniref:Uncharacterized protein n=1 Tax=Solanum tuberosum TaxID=4113 RepID=A0ABQ7TX86_SOLTU|nr:hypothetical protein KY289_036193 [Solanum tuberosum]KAH0639439.1 hypothetical protein KY285_036025 [Solanum tuberosum]KAH0738005.1 hypothetical protein KY290_036710 [Solanum tuberosum]
MRILSWPWKLESNNSSMHKLALPSICPHNRITYLFEGPNSSGVIENTIGGLDTDNWRTLWRVLSYLPTPQAFRFLIRIILREDEATLWILPTCRINGSDMGFILYFRAGVKVIREDYPLAFNCKLQKGIPTSLDSMNTEADQVKIPMEKFVCSLMKKVFLIVDILLLLIEDWLFNIFL